MRSSSAGLARPVRTEANSWRVASTDFVHALPRVLEQVVDHVVTTVPTRSPETIRSMLRSSSMLKT